MTLTPPADRPRNPCFSSGPCAKRPGWTAKAVSGAWLGRSHRAAGGKTRLVQVIERSRAILGIPDDYRLGIVPASDTGAIEMAMWSLLGSCGVDLVAWEAFGREWVADVAKHLKLDNIRIIEAEYGKLPDLGLVDRLRDVVFTWNGTTSGVRVPDGDWIDGNRGGLTICDATSAVFAMDLPWDKLDVVTWSWQKALGGEAGHGMLALSPRAVERLETFRPRRPLPKIFRLTKNDKLNEDIFTGSTINTPSMLCVQDAIDTLRWAEKIGGLEVLIARTQANFESVAAWVAAQDWIDFLAEDPATRSPTSICLKIVDPWFGALDSAAQAAAVERLTALVAEAEAGYDIGSYRDAPPGLRIWGGPTVAQADIEALLPWLDWAFAEVKTGAAVAQG